MKSLHKLLAALTVLAFILGYLPVQPAHALVYVVTNTNDDGEGSLREAISLAATTGMGDTITFDPSLAGLTIGLDSEIVFGKNLIIDGSGLDPHVKISGGGLVRVFNMTGSYNITISHLDIIDGNADDGGAIYNGTNTLSINNVNFSNNMSSANGGAIFNGGNMTITDSTFSNNSAALGGAIYHFHYALTITKTTFSGNSVIFKGGAIYNDSTSIYPLKIADTTFSDNSAVELGEGEGGAIYNNGTIALIKRTTFTVNQTDKNGGGIYNNGTITGITVSVFSGNTATLDGGGIYNNGTITSLNRSTLSGNSADNNGGAIRNKLGSASLLVMNSTFSGNNAQYQGGGIMSDGLLKVISATFSENDAGQGAGIAAAVNPVTLEGFSMVNTILANSLRGYDCYNLTGNTITFNRNNLIEFNGPTGHMCGIPAIEADPMLGPLANNGFKKTKTYMPLVTSPAIDAGNEKRCRKIDQRGKPRPVDGNADGSATNCDIGAVERQRTIKVMNFRSQAAYDGQIIESGENSNVGGKINDFDFNMKLGDNDANQQFRSFLSFDTSGLLGRAAVARVVLKIKQTGGPLGTNPFNLSDLVADIRKGSFSGDKALQSSDFQALADMNESSIFNGTPLPGGWYKGVLKPKARRYVNKKDVTQFRLRFTLDDNNNFLNDYIAFYTGDAENNLYHPLMIVQYYLP